MLKTTTEFGFDINYVLYLPNMACQKKWFPQWTTVTISNEFSEFMSKNEVQHTLVPPYHPQSNAAA